MFDKVIEDYYWSAKPVEMIIDELGIPADPKEIEDEAFLEYGVIRHPDTGILCKPTFDVPEIRGDDKASCFKRAYYNYVELSVNEICELFCVRKTLCDKYINELIRDYGVFRFRDRFWKYLDKEDIKSLRRETL